MRRRPKRRRVGDTTSGHTAAQASLLPEQLEQLDGQSRSRRRRHWRPCGDDWPTAKIQAALNFWDMLPPPPMVVSSSDSSLPSFPFIVCQPRRRSCEQSRDGSSDTFTSTRQAVLACMLPTIPAHPISSAPTTPTTPTTEDDSNVSTNNQPNTIIDEINKPQSQSPLQQQQHHQQQHDLIGAAVRINRGQFLHQTGIITEKMDVHLLQVDTVPTPLTIQDVYVLSYSSRYNGERFGKSDSGADGGWWGSNDVAPPTTSIEGYSDYIRNKYTGATVYVAPNSSANREYWGVQGTVMRVRALGIWYILDNPQVGMAFRPSSFDVLRYAHEIMGDKVDNDNNADTIEIDGDEGDDACVKEGVRPGQQPTENNTDGISNKQLFVSLDSRTSSESPKEARHVKVRNEDGGIHCASDTTETLYAKHATTATLPCADKNLNTAAEKGCMVDKEGVRIDSDSILITISPSIMTCLTDSVINVNATGDDENIAQVMDNSVMIENGEIRTTQQPVLLNDINNSNNDKAENTVESNQRSSTDGPKEEGRDEEEKEQDLSRASDIMEDEPSSNNFVDLTEDTGHPVTTIGNRNVAAGSTSIESSTTRRASPETAREETKVYSVKLPTMESIELAARLSAFDSFLFLAHGRFNSDDDSLIDVQGRGEMEDISMARSSDKVDVPSTTTKTRPLTKQDDDRIHSNDNAQRTVVFDLNRQYNESRNWPTAMALPGTEVMMDGEQQHQQPIRIVPLEERIVRSVPGSLAERAELSERLGAFDDYMFLLG